MEDNETRAWWLFLLTAEVWVAIALLLFAGLVYLLWKLSMRLI